jgi:NADH-quinone oxidoreductase subunit N
MDIYGIQLEIMLVLLGVAGLLVNVFVSRWSVRRIAGILAGSVGALFLYSLMMQPVPALFFKQLLLAGTGVALLLAMDSPSIRTQGAEFFSLMLFAAAGMLLLVSVNDFIGLFVALETVTLCFYILTTFPSGSHRDATVLEAGIKYLVMGAISASLTIYGISYLYGATGHTGFEAVRESMMQGGGTAEAYRFGFLLVFLGVGFKLAMVPLQLWAPDVYQGAPTPATAFLASCSKVAGFVLLLRLMDAGLFPPGRDSLILIGMLAGITLLYGTLGALAQVDLKRLLGYSSIAHAGYLLMGLAAGTVAGRGAVSYYLTQYLFTVLCAFLVVSTVANATGQTGRGVLMGLYRRSPLLALALFAAMMSLAGVPPLSGALGKFFILLELVKQGGVMGYSLAGLGALSAVISLVFYVGVLRPAFTASDAGESIIPVPRTIQLAIVICLSVMLILGVWPHLLIGDNP